ncbi:Uncharacterised protein [Eikenella corrodens]|uniref:Uncharacterized protein n=2 Tax=Eikenella corrodens TaxID=539 RepID=A0A8B4GLU7_EIKCO|nr:Uncharacterised protein [Eikenella corrodens]
MSNSVGCRYVDQAMPSFDANAALALYRLPAGQCRAVLDKVLAEHSSPSRKLSWNEQERMIYFDEYSPNKAPDPIPVNLNAGK